MARRWVHALLGCAVACAAIMYGSTSARAERLALDNVPANTLLFPYFEADTADTGNGPDTLISFHNASATAVLSHVVVWTDLGIPVLSFNVYQTGYDITSFSVRDVLINGNLPRTASAGQDPTDTISPHGIISQDINFASCSGQLPYPGSVLYEGYRADLKAALTGHGAVFLDGKCTAHDHGDAIARGYITIDTVNSCTTRGPADAGYFASDTTNQNTQSGEYFLVDSANALLHQGTAVAIEAGSELLIPGNYTFYGRLLGWGANDMREPLPTAWAVDAQAAGTELIVWRDPKVVPVPFTCGSSPGAGLPLGHESAFSFDNQEQPLGGPSGTPFGLATQRVVLGNATFPLPTKPGWVYLGLSWLSPVGSANPAQDPAADQAYVAVIQYPESHPGSTGTEAIALDGAQSATHSHPDSP